MKYPIISIICLLIVPIHNVYATRVDYMIGLSLAHHSNVNLESDPQSDETVFSATGNIAISEETANLIANLNATLTLTEYINDLAQDDLEGQLVGDALWIIEPKRYEWYLADVYTQTLVDPLGSNIPSNRTYANAFTTGPNYYVRIDQVNNLAFELRYNDITYGNHNGDNVTLFGAARWLYNIDHNTTAGLNYEEQHINYDNDLLNSDLVRKDLYASLAYRRGLNEFDVRLGEAEIIDDFGNKHQENIGGISLTNQRTRKLTIRLGAERSLTDTAAELLDLIEDPLDTDPVIVSSPDLYVQDRVYASCLYNSSRFSTEFTLYEEESSYINDVSLDDSVKGINLITSLILSGVETITFNARLAERKYPNIIPTRKDEDSLYSIQYLRNARRNLDLSILLGTERRKSTDPLDEYTNDSVVLSLVYRMI